MESFFQFDPALITDILVRGREDYRQKFLGYKLPLSVVSNSPALESICGLNGPIGTFDVFEHYMAIYHYLGALFDVQRTKEAAKPPTWDMLPPGYAKVTEQIQKKRKEVNALWLEVKQEVDRVLAAPGAKEYLKVINIFEMMIGLSTAIFAKALGKQADGFAIYEAIRQTNCIPCPPRNAHERERVKQIEDTCMGLS